jgi:hypothetical protein
VFNRRWFGQNLVSCYVCHFSVARNRCRIDAKHGDHFLQADLNEAARAADASREANGAVYGERLK